MHGYTAAAAAREFKIPAAALRQWISRGKVKRHKDGCIDLESLVKWLDRNKDMTAYWMQLTDH